MKRLLALISYFISNSSYPLNKTEIMKMVYLFEYYHYQTFGYQYTDIQFIRFDYGPFAAEVYTALDVLHQAGGINVYLYPMTGGRRAYLHEVNNMDVLREYSIDDDRKYIADETLHELSGLSYDDLIYKVYSTPPMAKITEEEDMVGEKELRRPLDMAECKPIKKFNREKIEAARKRLDKSSKGSDQEYYVNILEERKSIDYLRRRANECMMK
ncbi:MAG: Panacea domain-containing protein [Bacillota bacterium]|nr:Panacea domain-containing protein [Bacillota bacterium]